jgi:hyaluronan synthase
LGLIGLLSWSVWFVRRYLSHHRYREVVNDFSCTTSVVVPVYREDGEVLERCLRTWMGEEPDEIILVVDDHDTFLLNRLQDLDLPTVRIIPWRHTGKRGALAAGVRAATGDVIVFSDSDTSWRPGLLATVLMPFADARVGGVGSRQHVYLPDTHLCRRVAYWMLNTRYLDYVPAMSRGGGVACLSGRTAAYRRSVILPLLDPLEHEVFLGRECVAGDDGRLTWLVLAAGYRTVHQSSAHADSMFPDSWRAFLDQRVRWSRNSYRCYLTAMAQGWLWRQPMITQVTVLQVLLTPVTMGAALFYLLHWTLLGWTLLLIAVLWAILARAVRGFSHLREHPREILLAPLMAMVVAFIALPVKLWAACTMNRHGWLTRVDGDRVHGQREIHPAADGEKHHV